MRKLLIVLLLFILSIIGLVLLFNTLTNSSQQVKIAPNPNLVAFDINQQLSQAIQIPTMQDSLVEQHFAQFNQYIKANYAPVFASSNVEWQAFEKYSLVGKWIGRNASLAPIVLVANPSVATPDLEGVPEWSYNPFMGKIADSLVYGAGTQGGKMTAIALLAAWQKMIKSKVLPSRTIYFIFPHSPQGEKAILQALIASKKEPQFVLKTGGVIAQNMLWNLSNPIALIGIANPSIARIRLETKGYNTRPLLQQLEKELVSKLPAIDLDNNTVNQFVAKLSPETNFGNRLIFSNKWLLKNMQQKKLENNPLTKALLGATLKINTTSDSTQNTLTTIDIYTSQPFQDLKNWVNNNLQHPQINLLGEPELLQNQNYIAPTDNHAYRLLGNTCKEVFANTMIAPCIAESASFADIYANITPNVYYFNPIVHTNASWANKQKGIDEKITTANLEKAVQFYYQLLKSGIEE